MYQHLKIHSDFMKHQYNCIELSSRKLYTYKLSFLGSGLQGIIGLETSLESFVLPGRYRPGNSFDFTGLSVPK